MNSRLISILIGTIIGILLLIGYAAILEPDHDENMARESGQALIGGAFHMTDIDGHAVTDESFKGRYTLYYFGYSFCPDVCPLDMLRASMALDLLEEQEIDLSEFQGVFVTIDPERDTAEALREFLGGFNPAFTAIRGNAAETKTIADAFRVYYTQGEVYEDGFYTMDHSNLFYLMNPDGEFVQHFTSDLSPEEFASRLRSALNQ